MTEDPYAYPSGVLKNCWNIDDAEQLELLERNVAGARVVLLLRERVEGNYDLAHLQAFHKFIFDGIYPWAGEIRSVNIDKGIPFCLVPNIPAMAAEIFTELAEPRIFLRGLSLDEFVEGAAWLLGEINALHPFREGNGRAQRAFLSQLAADAGYLINWDDLEPSLNIEVSKRSLAANDVRAMAEMLADLIESLPEDD